MRFELIDNNIGVLRHDSNVAVRRNNRVRGKSNELGDRSDDDAGERRKTPANSLAKKKPEAAGRPDEDAGKYRGAKRLRNARSGSGGRLFLWLVALSLTLSFYVGIVLQIARRRHDSPLAVPETDSNLLRKVVGTGDKPKDALDVPVKPKAAEKIVPARDWSHCIENPPEPKERVFVESKIEPLWLPAYPTSLPSAGYAEFLTTLTGVPKAAKNYYRSSPQLKRCHMPHSEYKIQSVTCEIVHPIVPCERPHPSRQSDQFGSKMLFGLRNPITAFPAVHQSKAEAFHGQKGQVGKDDWMQFRDQYVGSTNTSHLMNEWKNFIMEWRNMDPYTVAAYLPWEYWTDEIQGPLMVNKIMMVLKGEGFPVLYDAKEAVCVWHKHIYIPTIAEENERVEESWYVPEYTLAQLEMIAVELEKFRKEIYDEMMENGKDGKGIRPGDPHLLAILNDYAKTIREAIHQKDDTA